MTSIVSRKIIKPENCVLAFGIPTTESDFVENLKSFNKGFSQFFKDQYGERALKEYIRQILDDLRTIEPILTELGLQIIHKLSLKTFGELFQQSKYDVIILFSHWEYDLIEFSGDLVGKSAVLDQIPTTFSGIIDFCICTSKSMGIDMRIERPNSLIRISKNEALPYFWLYFYLVLFKHLKQGNKSYIEALGDVVAEFSKKARRRKLYEKLRNIF